MSLFLNLTANPITEFSNASKSDIVRRQPFSRAGGHRRIISCLQNRTERKSSITRDCTGQRCSYCGRRFPYGIYSHDEFRS
jgi:hypothetical protein